MKTILATILFLLSMSAGAVTISVPACDTLSVTSQTATVVTLACGHTPTPPAPPTASPAPSNGLLDCSVNGFYPFTQDMAWPTTQNVLVPNVSFPPNYAIVVKFTTPASGRARFQPTAYAPNQGVSRLYTLSTVPCAFAKVNYADGNTVSGTVGGDPGINIIVGTCPYAANLCPVFGAYVKPNTVYYVTMVNRRGFFGTPGFVNSCSVADCMMRLEFNGSN
jgi:hypothetical protein